MSGEKGEREMKNIDSIFGLIMGIVYLIGAGLMLVTSDNPSLFELCVRIIGSAILFVYALAYIVISARLIKKGR
jgi:hypothetical protein